MPKSNQTENGGSLTKTQQVVALTAMQKGIKDRITELRESITGEMVEQYFDNDGADRRIARIGDAKVGSVSLRRSTDKYEITDVDKFEQYLKNNNYAEVAPTIQPYKVYELLEKLKSVVKQNRPLHTGDFECFFDEEIKPTKQFETIVRPLVNDCMDKLTGEIIPGIKPKKEEIIGITVKTEKPVDVVNALVSGCDNPLQNLLGDGENVQG